MVDDGLDRSIGVQGIDGESEVRLPVERQAALVAGFQVGFVAKDRAKLLGSAASLKNRFERGFEVNQMGSVRGKNESAGTFFLDGSAAERQHQRLGAQKPADGLVFQLAKPRLAVFREKLGDGGSRFRFDLRIGVNEEPPKTCGEKISNRGFAGAHESSEDDAVDRRCWMVDRLLCFGHLSLGEFRHDLERL
jgi:hypothetical protein